MAVMEKNLSKTINVVITTGQDTTANVSVGPVNPEAEPTNSQIWAMRTAMAPILEGTASKVTKTYKSELENFD